jgi:hypothetical protein
MIPIASLEAGIARLFALLDAAKKCLEGTVEAGEYILQDLGMDVVILWPHVLDTGQFRALVSTGDTLVAFLPSVAVFLESSVVEFPAATQHKRHLLLLLRCGQEFVLEGLVDGGFRR